jgi:hypothetical protein
LFDLKPHRSGGDENASFGLEEALVTVAPRRLVMWLAMTFLNVFQPG